MSSGPVHAFGDDALGDHDATALAALLRSGQVSCREVVEAAIARARRMQPVVNAVQVSDHDSARKAASRPGTGPFGGVPTYVKDNVDVSGLPTNHGTASFVASAARADSPLLRQLRGQGLVVLGKSRLPEFGFNASTEYADAAPVRNPWHPDYSAGASSGGAAALVASGVVPIAHANDGGGSIRIPAAACGLVGLKPTRGRLISDHGDQHLPVDIVGQGVVTRTVRDTARFLAGAERIHRNPSLPPIREIVGPSKTRLRFGVVFDSVPRAGSSGAGIDPALTATDAETRAAVTRTADLLGELGHHVEEIALPVSPRFADDFARYWALLGFLVTRFGRRVLAPDFDAAGTDGLTQGLAAMCRRELPRVPGALVRLRRSTQRYRAVFAEHDVVLSPVLAHTTPPLGHLSPRLGFEELFARLQRYVAFTPLNNAAGGPGISVPAGLTSTGLPLGVHFSADLGDERTLLEVAYALEEARPFPRIQDGATRLDP